MRKIDCAHSWSMKMLPWSWFRENIDFSTFFILVLGLKRRFSINKPRWYSNQAAAYWSQRSRIRIPLGYKFFCVKIEKFGRKNLYFPWIRVKEAFSRFGNARNRFFAWFYPYIGCFGKKIFGPRMTYYLHPLYFCAHSICWIEKTL